MGGNALRKVNTRRLNKDEYEKVENHVIKVISKITDKVGIPRYFKSKLSFGDLDIVFCSNDPEKVIQTAMKTFGSKDRFSNDSVTSIDYQFDDGSDPFQIDFIYSSIEDFNLKMFYLSYNDMGAILGMIFKSYGLSYGGEYGLFYKVLFNWDPCKCLGKIIITKDPIKISHIPAENCYAKKFENVFGGSDGLFQENNQVFDYISSSPLFDHIFWNEKSIYFNHEERNRFQKRPMYLDFVKNYIPKNFDISSGKNKPITTEIQEDFVVNLLIKFELIKEREKMFYEYKQKQEAKNKFNGVIVSKLVGLKGKELGIFMEKLLLMYPDLKESSYILSTSQETINKLIFDFYNKLIEN